MEPRYTLLSFALLCGSALLAQPTLNATNNVPAAGPNTR